MNKWKNLIYTHGVKEIINLFNHTFLGIYFFKITEGSILIVALYYLVYYLSHIFWRYLVSKFISTKNVIILYRVAIFTNLLISLILIVSKENIINYIYLFATIYAFSQCLYWTSYEVIINDLNKKNSLKKYFTYDSVLMNISNLVFPLTFGTIIEKLSYFIVFIILFIIAFISFLLSFTFKKFYVECNKINVSEFFKNIKNKKMLKLITIQSISDGLTNGGVAQLLTTLLIFNKVSSEFVVGCLSSVLSIICIGVAIIAERKINYNNYKKIVLPITIMAFLITIPISIKATLIMIIIYKIILDICDVLTNIEGNAITFKSLNYICDEKYKVDYLWYIELALNTGRGLGLLAIILVINLTSNVELLIVLFILFSFFFIVRSLSIIGLQNEIKKLKESL